MSENILERAVLAFILLPGIIAIGLPLLIGYFDPWGNPFFLPGIIVIFTGIILLIWCIRDFLVYGKGTLAPWNSPKDLVVNGLYRFVRNPMYESVLLLVLGWGIFFLSINIILYDIFLFIAFHIRVFRIEEPRLKKQFGKSWEIYKEKVSRWLPRKTTLKRL